MKGCLKLTSPIPARGLHSETQHLNGGAQRYHSHSPTTALSPGTTTTTFSCTNTNTGATQNQSQTHRKCVAFCAQGSEKVYTADEWDRTPIEPARKLSYQDILELKEIQRSLPLADQPADTVTGRPGKRFLSGVPIVLLPLLGSAASANGGDGEGAGRAQEGEAKKPPSHGYSPNAYGCANGNSNGWGPPGLTGSGGEARSEAQATTVRPSFPFPPRPVPLSTPTSTSTSTFARGPAPPISPSPTTQPLRTGFQTHSSTSSPYSSNRPSSNSTSPTYPHSNRPLQSPQIQAQSRMPWTPPPSLSHLMPSSPVKPREKPKFEFVALLDTGAGSGSSSSGPSANVTPGGGHGVGNMEAANTKVGREVAFQNTSKLPSGLLGIEAESGRGLMKKKKPKLNKEKKFILVNDMEVELDESDSESEGKGFAVLSGRTTNTIAGTTKIARTTTTSSSGNPPSSRSIAAPLPVKPASHPPPLPSSASVLLITPPSTPPSEHVSRYGSRNNSPTSSLSAASRGRKKGQAFSRT